MQRKTSSHNDPHQWSGIKVQNHARTEAEILKEVGITYKNNIHLLLDKLTSVEGDIIELGVYRGNNSVIIGSFLRKTSSNKKYIGFDTFCGYTEEDIEAARDPSGLIENQNSKRWVVPVQEVKDHIQEKNLSGYCKIIEGDIKETVPSYLKNRKEDYKISVFYLDCNAYLPAITALRSCKKYLSNNAMIVVDEHVVGGETRALKEFSEENNVDIYETSLGTVRGRSIGPPLYGIYHE